MSLKNTNIGFALTGSFCTFSKTLIQMDLLVKEGANVIPIMSENAYTMDTKFGTAKDFKERIQNITSKQILHTILQVEPIGPQKMTDIMVVAPASSNTIAKIASGINDTPVTMAIKSHLRNEKPVVIAISTNDALSASAENIGKLLNKKHFYFVPFRQDNPITKPRSIVYDPEYLIKTIKAALKDEQLQPIIL